VTGEAPFDVKCLGGWCFLFRVEMMHHSVWRCWMIFLMVWLL
jgi:hypothetical protein